MNYSIIIPTYNRPKTLALTLDSVCNQNLSPEKYEILVIDDGSIDNTKEVVSNFQKKYLNHNIHYFYEQNSGPAKARNYGIRESKGEIIFFTDDDCVVPENWMETLLDGYRRYPDVVGVGGWYKSAENNSGFFKKYIDSLNDKAEEEIKSNIFSLSLSGNTANMSYKKILLKEIGGFDENIYFPGLVDWELKKNIQNRGYQLLFIPFAVQHLKLFNFTNFIKKSFNQGRGSYYMTLKYSDLLLNPYYNLNFLNSIKNLIRYLFAVRKFFVSHFIYTVVSFLGKLYVEYFKHFKDVRQKKPCDFSIEWKMSRYCYNQILNTEIKLFDKSSAITGAMETNKFYSIIIPTYNRPKTLALTLDSVCNQNLSPEKYEILVIDDGSIDNTKEVVSNFQKKYLNHNIHYFYEQNSGPAKARNYGIRESKGEIIFFTDDDCVVPENWMETLLDGYRRYPDVVGVGGWLMAPENILENNFIERYIHYVHFWCHYFPTAVLFKNEIISNDPMMGLRGVFANNTANLSLYRKVLEKIGGFNEDFYWPGSEDADLIFRVLNSGYQMLYFPFPVSHIKVLDFMGFVKLHFKRGANSYLFLKFNQEVLEKIGELTKKDHIMFSLFINRLLYRPYKFLTFMQFFSQKAGFIYMKNKYEKL